MTQKSRSSYYRQWKEKNRERVLESQRAYREANREKHAAQCLAFYYRNKEQHMQAQRIYRETFPEKVQAHQAVRRAVKEGVLTREPCEVCASTKSHAHHDDYSKPLDVHWLCSTCHGLQHRRIL